MPAVTARWEKYLRLGQIACATFGLGLALLLNVLPQWSYNKDILIDYMTARALREGLPLFPVLRELQTRYFPGVPSVPTAYPYPNFHPPIVWAMSLPFSYLPFQVVEVLWLALTVAATVVAARWLGLSVRAGFALAIWPPIFWHLCVGQYELLVLVLTLWAWRSADTSHEWRAGILLGMASLLKFYPALLLLPYLYRRRWRVVAGGALAGAIGLAATLLLVGWDGAVFYVQGL